MVTPKRELPSTTQRRNHETRKQWWAETSKWSGSTFGIRKPKIVELTSWTWC